VVTLIDASSGKIVQSLGETHAAKLDTGVCVCGWTANGSDIRTKTWDHLYGDLDWIPREKLERLTGKRPE
jgi:hypothetical protein